MNDQGGGRLARGERAIEAAARDSGEHVAKRLAAFKAAHAKYIAADEKVSRASEALEEHQAKAGACDAAQDAAIETLASALAGDGFPRLDPFKPFGVVGPSALRSLGFEAEADEVLRLVAKLRNHPKVGATAEARADELENAARAVKAEVDALADHVKARNAALAQRDTVAQAWESALAALERARR